MLVLVGELGNSRDDPLAGVTTTLLVDRLGEPSGIYKEAGPPLTDRPAAAVVQSALNTSSPKSPAVVNVAAAAAAGVFSCWWWAARFCSAWSCELHHCAPLIHHFVSTKECSEKSNKALPSDWVTPTATLLLSAFIEKGIRFPLVAFNQEKCLSFYSVKMPLFKVWAAN